MGLTSQQNTTLKAFILADPTMSVQPMNEDGGYAIAELLNKTATPDFQVWNSRASIDSIFDSVIWANMTPAAPASADSTGIYRDRALTCQGKQFSLQTLLQGRQTIDATKTNIRSGLQDALTSLPSGTNGANQGAGWIAVQLVLQRTATVIEKLFATGTGSTASPALVVVTSISVRDVGYARNS